MPVAEVGFVLSLRAGLAKRQSIGADCTAVRHMIAEFDPILGQFVEVGFAIFGRVDARNLYRPYSPRFLK